MKILVFGNIGSGKSTLIGKLRNIIPWQVIAIDDFRRKFGNGSKENENLAQEHFFNTAKSTDNQYIECIGIGSVSEKLHSILCEKPDEKIICIKLIVPKDICLQRLEERVWDIPFPASLDKVNSLVDRTEDRINANGIEILWGKRNNTTIITMENVSNYSIDEIANELSQLIIHIMHPFNSAKDIDNMLDQVVQNYYGNEYNYYQKGKIEYTPKYKEDQLIISNFLSSLNIHGNLIDIGSGNSQWFPFLEKKISKYFAIDVNKESLSLIDKSPKITTIIQDIFNKEFVLEEAIQAKIDCVLFSFFLSHFSDSSIQVLFNKIKSINSILIIDTLWCEHHKKRYSTKELSNIRRRISEDKFIYLPKRFFEYSDMVNIGYLYGYNITNFIEGNYCFVCLMEMQT